MEPKADRSSDAPKVRGLPSGWRSVSDLIERIAGLGEADSTALVQAWERALAGWITEVVMRPEPRLGRSGPLCPWVPTALARDLLFLVATAADGSDEDRVCQEMVRQRDAFLDAPPRQPEEHSVTKSLIVAFPEMPAGRMPQLQDIRRRIKPGFLDLGVTCGEFYPQSDDRSPRNREFRVARSPVPCIAIRYLTPHDELFLSSQPDLYPLFQAYRQRQEAQQRIGGS